MATPAARAHIEGERRLRQFNAAAAERIWRDLSGYDERNVDEWLSRFLPVTNAVQRQSVVLTDAYLATALGRAPVGVVPDELLTALRNGVAPEDVYRRPFVTLWSGLSEGQPFEDAFAAALARVTTTARLDPQLAMRATANAVQGADENIYGYTRVADAGACQFCAEVDGAYVKDADAMPLHNGCGCGLEPLTSPHPRAAKLPSGVAVRQHGEIGPVLMDPAHDFTSESDL